MSTNLLVAISFRLYFILLFSCIFILTLLSYFSCFILIGLCLRFDASSGYYYDITYRA